jgi:dolichyl-phosphate-mannose--protein O-mannosyl transferase
MIDRSSSSPLASNTKKRRKTAAALRVFLNIVIVIAFTFASSVAVPRPWVFHSWRRKMWVDDWLGGLKTHRRAHLTLALLKRGKSLTHLLV